MMYQLKVGECRVLVTYEMYGKGKVIHDIVVQLGYATMLKLGWIVQQKTVLDSTCLRGFAESVDIVNAQQEAFAIFDKEPSVRELNMLGYEPV